MATRKVDPKYPLQLMRKNVAGTVILYAIIHADGTVGSVRVLRGVDDRIDQFASQAVAQWQFQPATKNGTPVDVEATFQIPFRPAGSGRFLISSSRDCHPEPARGRCFPQRSGALALLQRRVNRRIGADFVVLPLGPAGHREICRIDARNAALAHHDLAEDGMVDWDRGAEQLVLAFIRRRQ